MNDIYRMELIPQKKPPLPPLNLSGGMTYFDFIKSLGGELKWPSLKELHEKQTKFAGTSAGDRCIRGEFALAQWISEQHKEGIIRMEAPVRIVGPESSVKYIPDVHFQNGVTWMGEVYDNPAKREENFVTKCRHYRNSGAHRIIISSPSDRTSSMYDWRKLRGSAYHFYYFEDSVEQFDELLKGKIEGKDMFHRLKMPKPKN